jgi:hypothetical protein
VVCNLPTVKEDSWVSPELEQWLLIAHDIAEIGCDDKRYKHYFDLQTFTAEACKLGELAFKLNMRPVIYFHGLQIGESGFLHMRTGGPSLVCQMTPGFQQ